MSFNPYILLLLFLSLWVFSFSSIAQSGKPGIIIMGQDTLGIEIIESVELTNALKITYIERAVGDSIILSEVEKITSIEFGNHYWLNKTVEYSGEINDWLVEPVVLGPLSYYIAYFPDGNIRVMSADGINFIGFQPESSYEFLVIKVPRFDYFIKDEKINQNKINNLSEASFIDLVHAFNAYIDPERYLTESIDKKVHKKAGIFVGPTSARITSLDPGVGGTLNSSIKPEFGIGLESIFNRRLSIFTGIGYQFMEYNLVDSLNTAESADLSSLEILLNVKYQPFINSRLSPYLLAGIVPHLFTGENVLVGKGTYYTANFSLAYNFGAGIYIGNSRKTSLEFRYSFYKMKADYYEGNFYAVVDIFKIHQFSLSFLYFFSF